MPDVPNGLGSRGREMWKQLLEQDASLAEKGEPRRQVALEACRVADLVDRMEREAAETPVTLETRSGFMTHPVHVELRQQRLALARLLSGLRLPDVATGRRPQQRPGVRGTYAGRVGTVSSLDRARQASGQ